MKMPKRKTLKEMEAACAAFNAAHRIGGLISVTRKAIGDEWIDVTIAAPGAHVLGGHTAVVQVEGLGCIALSHVRNAS